MRVVRPLTIAVLTACGSPNKGAAPAPAANDVCTNARTVDVVLVAPKSDHERIVHRALQQKLAGAKEIVLIGAPRAGSCTLALETSVTAVEHADRSARVVVVVAAYREPAHEHVGNIEKKLTAQDPTPDETRRIDEQLLGHAGSSAGDSFATSWRALVRE